MMPDKVICPECGKEFSKYGIKNHIEIIHNKSRRGPSYGKQNPYKGMSNLEIFGEERAIEIANKISVKLKGQSYNLGIPLSDEHKKAVSEGMKRAHAEGRAWNIGMSRWNNEPSYPEKFFMQVIENEFEDKDYQREFPLGIYSFDFAWPHLMKAIEIDGAQHERFIEYQERDQRKDIYAAENGWKVLRISWKEFYNDTKYWIQISKNFIGREAS